MGKTPFRLVLRPLAIAGAALALLLLAAFPLRADFAAKDWPFFKLVVLPQGMGQEGLVEVVPDQDVFAHAASALVDLRVVEEESQREVPYELLVERGDSRRAAMPVAVRDLTHIPGEETSFVVEVAGQGVPHNEIEVATPSRSFQRRTVVESGADGRTWSLLQQGYQIFDLTIQERNFTTRDTRIRYPESTARYLRIHILDNGEEPLDIRGATLFQVQEIAPQEVAYPAALVGREEQPQQRQSRLLVDLGGQGLPHSRIVLATPQVNFYRQVDLEGSNDQKTWSRLGGPAAVYSFDTSKYVGKRLSFSYPEATYRYLRLTIANEDNPPLPVEGVEVFGFLRKLIFSASPGSGYRLYYGNAGARAPSYEFERVFPYLVTEGLPRAQLGAQTSNPSFEQVKPPPEPFSERYPWLLPAAVALAALGIGAFLASIVRQIRKVLPPPS
ncbi:MAG: DUF3999 family protein [Chloroflexi bacterium]|nr:DUF3999 family protein [Chloroflexota bacterium]